MSQTVDYQSRPPQTPAPMTDRRFIKLMVLLNGGVPLAMLVWDSIRHNLGVDVTATLINTTGLLTLIFLILTLAVTPLRTLTGLQWLFHARRLLGLYACFHALLHVTIYIMVQKGGKFGAAFAEIFSSTYLIIGLIGVLSMLPLAATSTSGMVRRLGAQRWKRLHMLVYLAGAMGAMHFLMAQKAPDALELALAGLMFALLLYRPIAFFVRRGAPRSAATASSGNRWQGQLVVQAITRETSDVQTFRLAAPAGDLPFAYKPGQYLTLALTIGNKPVYRSYTIASSPTRPGTCELTIKREPMGAGSRHMHDVIKTGDRLDVAAPSGDFVFDPTSASAVVLIAGGVGITPLMSILRALVDQQWGGDIHLIYANKTEADIIFRDQLADLQHRAPNLRVTFTLTRETSPAWTGRRGRIDAALLAEIPNLASLPIYLCGPAEMIKVTRAALASLNVPAGNIHTESFGVSAPPIHGDTPVKTFAVIFTQSGVTADVSSATPLLEAAEANKVDADFECRSGICGRCKCRLVSGTVSMNARDALTEQDQARNVILLCQARAASDVTLDL